MWLFRPFNGIIPIVHGGITIIRYAQRGRKMTRDDSNYSVVPLPARADFRTFSPANPGVSIPMTCVPPHLKGLSIAVAFQIAACLEIAMRSNVQYPLGRARGGRTTYIWNTVFTGRSHSVGL